MINVELVSYSVHGLLHPTLNLCIKYGMILIKVLFMGSDR